MRYTVSFLPSLLLLAAGVASFQHTPCVTKVTTITGTLANQQRPAKKTGQIFRLPVLGESSDANKDNNNGAESRGVANVDIAKDFDKIGGSNTSEGPKIDFFSMCVK